MIICPNLKNPDVAREFNELVQATSELAAYHIWSLNNGNAIDKAPNGAYSKLFLSLLDYYGGDRVKAIQAKAKTYSKSFLNWFGDWIEDSKNASKVVDKNGEPLTVYHYSDNETLTKFSTDFDNYFSQTGGTKKAIFFTEDNPNEEERGSNFLTKRKNKIAAFLNIKDLKTYKGTKEDLHNQGTSYREVVNKSAEENDVDGGVHMEDFDDNKKEHQSIWIIHNPNQIKSIDNQGTFSKTNNDIFYLTGDNRLKYRKQNIEWLKNYYTQQDFFKDYVNRLYDSIKLYKKNIEAYKFYDERNADNESDKLARVESTIKQIKASPISRYFDVDTHRLSNGDIKITVTVDKTTIQDRILSIIDLYSDDQLYSELQRIDQEGSDDYLYYINPRKVLTLKDLIQRKVAYYNAAVVDESMQYLIDLPNDPENNLFVECCIRWLKNNFVLLPRDAEKLRQVFDLARSKQIDVQSAKSPIDLIVKSIKDNIIKYNRGTIDMSKYDRFRHNRTIEVNGKQIDIFDVENSYEGRQQVCQILADNAPLVNGKPIKFSPWCLSTYNINDEGVATPTESANYHWDHYDGDYRQIAVHNGKPIAFRSGVFNTVAQWWDFNDRPHKISTFDLRNISDEDYILCFNNIDIDVVDTVYKNNVEIDEIRTENYTFGNYDVFLKHKDVKCITFNNGNLRIDLFEDGRRSLDLTTDLSYVNIIDNSGFSNIYLGGILKFDNDNDIVDIPNLENLSTRESIIRNIVNFISRTIPYKSGISHEVKKTIINMHAYDIRQYAEDYVRNNEDELNKIIKASHDLLSALKRILYTIPINLYEVFRILKDSNLSSLINDLDYEIRDYAIFAKYATDEEFIDLERLRNSANMLDSELIRAILSNMFESEDSPYYFTSLMDDILSPEAIAYKEDWYQRKYDEYIEKPVNKELAEILHNILKEYHFEIIEQDLTDLFGSDTKGALDFVQKIVYLANEGDRNAITDAEEFSHAFIKLMGARYRGEKTRDKYKENKKYSELIDLVVKTPFYENIYEQYKTVYVSEYGDIDKMKIAEEALGKALAVVLNNRYDTIKNTAEQEDKTLFERISEWFNAILRRIKKLLTRNGRQLDKLLNELDKVADSILDGTYTKKYLKKLNDSGWKNYGYEETIDYARKHGGELGIRLMLDMVNLGGVVTGSLSYRALTPIKRAGVDYLHDIDIAFPLSAHGILSAYPKNPHTFPSMYFNGTPDRPSVWTMDELLKIINENPRGALILRTLESYPNYRILYSFTTDGDILVSGVFSENEKAVLKFINSTGSYKNRMKNLSKKEQKLIFIVDIFLNGSNSVSENTVQDEANNLKLAHFSESFRKKLKFGRAKDIYDYQNLNPNNRVYRVGRTYLNNFDDYLQISENDAVNTAQMSYDVQQDYEQSITQSVTQFIGNKPDATDSEIIEKEQEAAIDWATQRQREIFTETQMHLASAYGLVMQPDGTWSSEDGKQNKVVVEFVNSLGHPGEYLDHELLATAHDVIRVGLMEGDASTFNHELAHHYLHMFWNSKPVQDALKVVYRKSMGDLNTPEGRKNVEEALVDMMTEYSVNDAFLKDIENLPMRTRFWNAFNVMLYKAFGIKNNVNKRALAMLITKSFIVNELLNNNLRKVDIEKYNDVLYQSEYQKRKAKDFATYEIVNKTREDQELIQRIVRTTQSKAKSYELKSAVTRFGSIYNDHEQRIRNRETVRKIKQDLSSIKEARISLDSALELSKNASIIKTFIGSAILDVTRAIEMMNNAKANQYRNVYYKESGGVRQYRDDNDQYYTNASNNATENKFSFDELLYVREEIISYIKPIMELINTVISNAEELGYENEDVDEIREMIRDSRFDELMSDLHSLYSKANRTLVYGYVDSEIDDQEYLDDDLKQRLKINTHNWLRQQNNFGDVSWYELYIGIGQHSKSDLVRLIQSRINNMHNEVDDIVNEKQSQLRILFDKAKKATHKKYPNLFGRNFLKLLMQLDRNGLPTGKFVSEVNDGQYQQDFEEYRDKLLFGQNGLETKLQQLVDDDGNHLFVDVDGNVAKLEIDELGYPIVPMINKCEALVKDYLLSIERWKCDHANRQFTYKYYEQRINTLSLSTLRKIDLLNKDINDIKNTVTDTEPIKDNNGNITGYNKIFRIDRLMPSQQLELLRLNNERMFLGSIYYEDGTLKPDTSEEFLMAMELIEFGRKIRGKIAYTTDWESFNRSRDNSLDKDEFDRKFTHWQVKSDYFKQLAKWNLDALRQDYPDLAHLIEVVKDLLRQRQVLTQQFRGLAIGEIKWDRLVDESTGRLKAIPMWKLLKEIDEEISEYRAEISGTIREILKDKEIRKTFGQKYRINGKAFTDLMYRVMIPENIHIKWDELMYMYDSIRAKVAQSISSDTSLTYAQILLRISDEFALMTYHDFLDGVDYPLDIFKTTLAYNKEEGYEQIPIQQFSKVDVLNSSSEYVNKEYDQSSESFEQPRMYDSHGNKLYKDDRYDLVKNVPELKEFLDALQNTMKEAWSWIPYLLKYDNRLGLVGGRTGQILGRFGYGNKAKQFLHNLGTFISREFSVVETDVEFAPEGDVQVRPDGSRIKNLPIRFIKMLDNPEYISSDIMGSTMRVFEMAANYKTRSKEVSALLEILSHVNESNINSGNSSDKSRLAEVIEGMLDRQIYEKLMFMPYINEDSLNQSMDKWKYMDWFRKGVISTPKNWIKRIGRLRIAFLLGLLANNFISGVVSFLDPLISMSIDAVTGKYINIFDLSTGAIKLAMDMPQGIRSLGKIKVSSETHALMQLFTLSDSTSESYKDYDKNQIYRFISDGLTMKHFSFGDYTLMALNLYATLNNWRYYKDSTGLENFYPKELFIKHAMDVDGLSYKLAKRKYKEAVTARYAFKLNKSNGKEEIVEKYKDAMSTRTFRLIKRQAKSRSSIYNAIVNREERTALQSNVFTQFLTTVRNFMLVGIAEYFKSWRSYQVTEFDENGNPTEENVRKKITPKEAKNQQRYYKGGYNYETLRNEDGIYSSIISLIFRLGPYLKYMIRAILHPRTIGNRYSKERESYLKLNQLNDLALYGTAKVMLNILAVFGLFLLSGITSTAADDDKDSYGKLFWNLIVLRVLIERLTWLNPTTFFELISSPTATFSDMKRKLRLLDLIFDAFGFNGKHLNDVIQRGNFKGRKRWEYDLANMLSTLGLYNWYTNMPSNIKIPFTDIEIPTFGGGAYTLREKTRYYNKFTPQSIDSFFKSESESEENDSSAVVPF